MALWTPAEITTALWLDAADSGTITSDSGLVSQWRDKSGQSRHFWASGATRPALTAAGLNDQSILTFNNDFLTSDLSASTWTFLHDGTGSTIFAVWQAGNVASPTTWYPLLGNNRTASASIGTAIAYDNTTGGKLYNYTSRGVTGSEVIFNTTPGSSHPANAPILISSIADPSNSAAIDRSEIFINGAAQQKANAATGSPSGSTPTYALQIGSTGDGSKTMEGYIAEIVIISGIVSIDDRQKIEGYLAHKWGLQANLPADHPYKTSAPTSGTPVSTSYDTRFSLSLDRLLSHDTKAAISTSIQYQADTMAAVRRAVQSLVDSAVAVSRSVSGDYDTRVAVSEQTEVSVDFDTVASISRAVDFDGDTSAGVSRGLSLAADTRVVVTTDQSVTILFDSLVAISRELASVTDAQVAISRGMLAVADAKVATSTEVVTAADTVLCVSNCSTIMIPFDTLVQVSTEQEFAADTYVLVMTTAGWQKVIVNPQLLNITPKRSIVRA